MADGRNWKETYLNEEGKMENGSQEKEDVFFDRIARQIREVVNHFKHENKTIARRANHAKVLAGFTEAVFRVSPVLAEDLAVGFLIPAREYRAILRFSNAGGAVKNDDSAPDLRGVAMKIITESMEHDFLMTNAELHHAKDAREAMIAIQAGVEKDIIADKIPDTLPMEDTIAGLVGAIPFLIKHLGFKTGWHIAATLKKQMKIKIESLSTETFWSRAPLAVGKTTDAENAVAFKYRLRPAVKKTDQEKIHCSSPDLAQKIEEELCMSDIKFYFEVQRFQDAESTPIEDATRSWGDQQSFATIAELIIPRNSKNEKEAVDAFTFSPWNLDLKYFKPLGSMNRSRKKVYRASRDERMKK